MGGRRSPLGLALGLSLALAACSGGGASPTPVATNAIDLPPSYRFEPADIVVEAGTTVTWTNHDNFTHSVRLLDDGGEVLQLPQGASVSFTFETPGLHRYDCSYHPQDMHGTVLVLGDDGTTSTAPSQAAESSVPASVAPASVAPGDY